MSFISTTLPAATASLVNQAAPQARPQETPTAPQNIPMSQLATQSAAILSLSTEGKNRSTSTGASRRVDAAFDKESNRGTSSEKTSGEKKSSRTVSVSA